VIRRRSLLKISALLVAGTCAYAAYRYYARTVHFDALTARSHAVEEQLIRALPRVGDTAPLGTLLPAASMKDDPPKFVCTVTPYEQASDIPQLAGLNLGLDGGWLDSVEETWIGVVALDARGGISSVVRLSRRKVDLLPHTVLGQCYRPTDVKLVRVGTAPVEGALELTIQANQTAQ